MVSNIKRTISFSPRRIKPSSGSLSSFLFDVQSSFFFAENKLDKDRKVFNKTIEFRKKNCSDVTWTFFQQNRQRCFFLDKNKSYEDWFQRCFFFRKKTHCWCYFNLVPTKLSKILCFLPTTKNFWGFQSCFFFNQLYFFSGQLSIVVRFFTLYKENLLFYLDVCFKNKEKKFVIFLSSRKKNFVI